MTGTVIFGAHRTGTTGLYNAIRGVLPAGTRALFEPSRYVPRAADEGVLAKVMLAVPGVLGTPPVDYDSFMGFERKIYVVRDPRDQVISGMLFMAFSVGRKGHRVDHVVRLLQEKEAAPGSVSLMRLLEAVVTLHPPLTAASLLDWVRRQHDWLFAFEDRLGPHFTSRYEDFVAGRLDALQSWLGCPPLAGAEVGGAAPGIARSRRSGNWRAWFVESDVPRFAPLLEPYLRRHAYPADWTLDPHPVLHPAEGSDYLLASAR